MCGSPLFRIINEAWKFKNKDLPHAYLGIDIASRREEMLGDNTAIVECINYINESNFCD
jgi:hypothetical protein